MLGFPFDISLWTESFRPWNWPGFLVLSIVFVAARVDAEKPTPEVTFRPRPPAGLVENQIDRFSVGKFKPPGTTDRTLHYRLFVPTRASSNAKLPLLLWMHGYGESGDDNWRHLVYIREEVDKWERERGGFPCYVLAPQSAFEPHWSKSSLTNVVSLLHAVVNAEGVDKTRIYLAGVSTGGSACLQIAADNPHLFAAIAPMASDGSVNPESLTQIPIWAFHVTNDPYLSPEGMRKTLSAINAVGGTCWLTETAGDEHDCWTAAFEKYDVTKWILKQQRHTTSMPPPIWVTPVSYVSRNVTLENCRPLLPYALVGTSLLGLSIFSWLASTVTNERRRRLAYLIWLGMGISGIAILFLDNYSLSAPLSDWIAANWQILAFAINLTIVVVLVMVRRRMASNA
jgi:predicted esterase